MPGQPTTGPRVCEWEITLACDLSCEHCCARAGRPRPHELSTGDALTIASQLAGIGCRAVTLTGGEPLLRPDWPEIAGALAAHGVAVAVSTSGSTVDRGAALAMRAAGVVAASVSLDGTERTHDRIRGRRGSFGRASRAVGLLRNAGIDAGISTTVTRRNRTEIPGMHGIAVESGASFWKILLGAQSGLSRPGLWLGPADLGCLVPEIAELQRSSAIEVIPGDDLGCWSGISPFRAPRSTEPRRWAGCQSGRSSIGMLSDGRVTGCLGMAWHGHRGPSFIEGNACGESLESIWNRPGAFRLARDVGRHSMAGACASCGAAAACGGGCLWIATIGPGLMVENGYCSRLRARTSRGGRPGVALARVPAAVALGLGLAVAGCGHGAREVTPPLAGPEKCMEEPPTQAQAPASPEGCGEPPTAEPDRQAVPEAEDCKPDPCCYMRAMIPDCNCCWGMPTE